MATARSRAATGTSCPPGPTAISRALRGRFARRCSSPMCARPPAAARAATIAIPSSSAAGPSCIMDRSAISSICGGRWRPCSTTSSIRRAAARRIRSCFSCLPCSSVSTVIPSVPWPRRSPSSSGLPNAWDARHSCASRRPSPTAAIFMRSAMPRIGKLPRSMQVHGVEWRLLPRLRAAQRRRQRLGGGSGRIRDHRRGKRRRRSPFRDGRCGNGARLPSVFRMKASPRSALRASPRHRPCPFPAIPRCRHGR